MKYLDEYRDAAATAAIADQIRREVTRPHVVMEVCGGQTHAILRYGLDRMLPPEVELVHGPGCPVCVTALETIDRAHAIAQRPGVIFTSFGDMLRVPGSHGDLLGLRARGADVRIVYSPLDAVELARAHRDRPVVFFGIGFETTAPANAMALIAARRGGVANFSMLASHVLVPPAIASILQSRDNRVGAFLGPGHVCAITGARAYASLVARYRVPIAITGFEPVDLLRGVLAVVRQLEAGRAELENAYARSAPLAGNPAARAALAEVFEVVDRNWRGIGAIPKSGYRIAEAYRAHDADRIFDVGEIATREPEACISGRVLRGVAKPSECPAFGRTCTPATPLGATMVSAEGACAAYYQHRRTA
ncbi:MAG: hydrogenase formation protein HypD [Deltaproteobacteria bacterium]|nr:hydrogenase formation protein HypD [Deltaproteobacteria bacterium]